MFVIQAIIVFKETNSNFRQLCMNTDVKLCSYRAVN